MSWGKALIFNVLFSIKTRFVIIGLLTYGLTNYAAVPADGVGMAAF